MKNKYQELIQPKLPDLAAFLNSGHSAAGAAAYLGISLSTMRRYRKLYPEFNELFEQRSQLCDDMVEAALLKRATGYEDRSGKEIAPDVRAALFWLQNRRPKKWKRSSGNKKKNLQSKLTIQLTPIESEL